MFVNINRKTGEKSLAKDFKKGDKVEWQTVKSKTIGEVEKKLTSPTKIKGHQVTASSEQPQYLVESDKMGKEAAHKPDALKKVEE